MDKELLAFDKSDILQVTCGFPEDSKNALKNAETVAIPDNYKNITRVIISGMGGSCISGDILKTWLWNKADIPVFVNRSSILPNFADANTLCVFISYSGSTRETLTCAREAVKRGCKNIAITYGGELKQLAEQENFVLVHVQGKPKMPRCAIGDLFFSLAGILSKIPLFNIELSDINDSITVLKEMSKNYDLRESLENELFDFAKTISGKKLAVFGVSPYTEAVALRWKTQFNENSKKEVLYNCFPELTHNEVVGLGLENSDYYFIVLRDKAEDEFLKNQVEKTMELITKPENVRYFSFEGSNLLERMMKLLYTGDYLSVYVALLNGVDPSPIDIIVSLKDKMKDIK